MSTAKQSSRCHRPVVLAGLAAVVVVAALTAALCVLLLPTGDQAGGPRVAASAGQTRIGASDGVAFAGLGNAVAVSGNVVVAAADMDEHAGTLSGAVYVFTRTEATAAWAQQKLTASDAAANDEFGLSVAIDGSTIVVAAPAYSRDGAGAAYVFALASSGVWTEQQKLTAPGAKAGLDFGGSVGVHGDTIVVGAENGDGGGVGAGAAYVFQRTGTTWVHQQKLIGRPTNSTLDSFGHSVAIEGGTIVVGARGDTDRGYDAGAAYVFSRNGTTWATLQKLTALDGNTSHEFGGSVTISGSHIVVGASQDDTVAQVAGSVYVFDFSHNTSSWVQQQKLLASDAAAEQQFGYALDMDGGTLVAGAWADTHAGHQSGAAYVFHRTASGVWTEQTKLTAANAAAEDYFGSSVGISGDTIVVGAIGRDDAGPDSGAVFVFQD